MNEQFKNPLSKATMIFTPMPGAYRHSAASTIAPLRCTWLLLCSVSLLLLGASVNADIKSDSIPAPVTLNSGWQLHTFAGVTGGGEAVSMAAYNARRWYPATVPGTVLTSLVNNGVFPEPLYGLNSQRIPDTLCRTSYWYRATFSVPRSYNGKHVWINFQGINYAAVVWVNGTKVGHVEGAFARGIFEITACLSHSDRNVVAVQIEPPTQPGIPVPQTLGKGYGPNGGVLEGSTPTFIDTMGWDWMPGIADRDIGLWQGVTLSATGPVVIENPYVTSAVTMRPMNAADLTVQADLRNVTGKLVTGILRGTVAGHAFSRMVSIPANATKSVTLHSADTPALHLNHPALWWPNGYGSHPLYAMPLTFSVDGKVSDTRTVNFGVRSITYGTAGESGILKLTVNGVPMMIRGGDWGMDEALKRSPSSRLEAQIKLNALAGFTMIRNWCGQTTQEDFYRLCDKYGILVWDDFWLDDTVHYGIAQQKDVFLANAREKLLRFRNHPCIALWCEKNEFPIGPPFEADLRHVTEQLDPLRWLQACSSSGHGVGDGHYGIEPVANYFLPFPDAFHTEMGAPSIPTLESLHAMMPREDWNTFNDDWTEHDMCQFNYAPALTARYGPVVDTEDFVRKAQLADYETYRAIFEGRNANLLNPNTGIMIWMSNPAQPSLVWQIYSYDLEPNSSYFGVMHACEMVHVQMTPSGTVQIVNNSGNFLHGLHVRAEVYNLDGRLAGTLNRVTDAPHFAAATVLKIHWPANTDAVQFVRLTAWNTQGVLVSENFYWHSPLAEDNCSDLQTLPRVRLKVHATRRDSAGRCHLTIAMSNSTHSIALLAHLQLRRTNSGARVLPVYYSDNYISLVPGETRTVTADMSVTDLHGDEPRLTVDGWNVIAGSWHGRHVSVGPNTDTGLAHPAAIRAIKCGVGWIPGYAADCDVQGGAVSANDEIVDTRGVAGAGPTILYRSERHGECTYSIPVNSRRPYTVILHFAETYYTQPGQRVFGVSINNHMVLNNFDILAEGGRDRPVVKRFSDIAPNPDGKINIHLLPGKADQPAICGIQIVPAR